MLKQQNTKDPMQIALGIIEKDHAILEKLDDPPTPQPFIEDTYKGTCYDEPCFSHPPNNEYGWCEKRQCYLTVDLAKRQRLCDTEQTRYHPNHKDNANHKSTPKATKPPRKNRA